MESRAADHQQRLHVRSDALHHSKQVALGRRGGVQARTRPADPEERSRSRSSVVSRPPRVRARERAPVRARLAQVAWGRNLAAPATSCASGLHGSSRSGSTQLGTAARRGRAAHSSIVTRGMMRRMRAYAPGASGFVGAHVVRDLRHAGAEVGGVVDRPPRPRAPGRAVEGRYAVFHLAAVQSTRPEPEHERVNVEGTPCCRRARLETSTGEPPRHIEYGRDVAVAGRPATEEDAPPEWPRRAVQASFEARAGSLSPSRRRGRRGRRRQSGRPVGEAAPFPDADGQMIESVAVGRYRAFIDTGLNARRRPRPLHAAICSPRAGTGGERYILGAPTSRSGRAVPGHCRTSLTGAAARLRVPYAAALTRARPRTPTRSRRPLRCQWDKAARDLGYNPGRRAGARGPYATPFAGRSFSDVAP